MINDSGVGTTSRRSFLSLSAAASAALVLRIVTEPMLAGARVKNVPKDAIRIDLNENPLGPCPASREAVAAIAGQGGRYCDWLTDDLVKALAEMEGLKAELCIILLLLSFRRSGATSRPIRGMKPACSSPMRSAPRW